jgi:hypothetical protein
MKRCASSAFSGDIILLITCSLSPSLLFLSKCSAIISPFTDCDEKEMEKGFRK